MQFSVPTGAGVHAQLVMHPPIGTICHAFHHQLACQRCCSLLVARLEAQIATLASNMLENPACPHFSQHTSRPPHRCSGILSRRALMPLHCSDALGHSAHQTLTRLFLHDTPPHVQANQGTMMLHHTATRLPAGSSRTCPAGGLHHPMGRASIRRAPVVRVQATVMESAKAAAGPTPAPVPDKLAAQWYNDVA